MSKSINFTTHINIKFDSIHNTLTNKKYINSIQISFASQVKIRRKKSHTNHEPHRRRTPAPLCRLHPLRPAWPSSWLRRPRPALGLHPRRRPVLGSLAVLGPCDCSEARGMRRALRRGHEAHPTPPVRGTPPANERGKRDEKEIEEKI
jgi:hypothetical protein